MNASKTCSPGIKEINISEMKCIGTGLDRANDRKDQAYKKFKFNNGRECSQV